MLALWSASDELRRWNFSGLSHGSIWPDVHFYPTDGCTALVTIPLESAWSNDPFHSEVHLIPEWIFKPDWINVPHSIPISLQQQSRNPVLATLLSQPALWTSAFRQDESDFWTEAFSQVWIISLASSSAHHTDKALQISSRRMVLLLMYEWTHSQVLGVHTGAAHWKAG